MANNTVTIELELYNKLRDFKKTIDENYTIEESLWDFSKKVYSNDKAIIKLTKEIHQAKIENATIAKSTEKSMNEKFAKMSIVEFILWRKKQ